LTENIYRDVITFFIIPIKSRDIAIDRVYWLVDYPGDSYA